MDSKHEITIRQLSDNSGGRNFLIGVGVLFLLWRFWTSGSLLHAIGFAAGVSTGYEAGYSSATLIILQLAVQVVIIVGSIAAAIGLGVWAVLWDFILGLYEALQAWKARNAAITSATLAAKAVATEAAMVNATAAGLSVGMAAGPITESGDPIDLEMVADAIQRVHEDLVELRNRVNVLSLPKRRSTTQTAQVTRSSKRLDKTEEARG